jgi:hypothetical protein
MFSVEEAADERRSQVESKFDMAGVRGALQPLADTLGVDGYVLEIVSATDASLRNASARVELRIEAGPGACADCLVPKDVFMSIATDRLGRAGIGAEITVHYPADASV